MARAIARNRRRYGGYLVHAGIALLLIGIAASSSFQTNRDVSLAVGESADVGDYGHVFGAGGGSEERANFVRGAARRHARREVLRNAEPGAELPHAGPERRGDRPLLHGESTSEVGMKSEAGGDLWTAFQPDLSVLNPDIIRGNRELAGSRRRDRIAILALAEKYAQNPPPATFRVIVNPLVSWIWIGALIALAGAALAAWPALEARRQLDAAYRAGSAVSWRYLRAGRRTRPPEPA